MLSCQHQLRRKSVLVLLSSGTSVPHVTAAAALMLHDVTEVSALYAAGRVASQIRAVRRPSECASVDFRSNTGAGRVAHASLVPVSWHAIVRWGPQTMLQAQLRSSWTGQGCDARLLSSQAVAAAASGTRSLGRARRRRLRVSKNVVKSSAVCKTG